MGNCAGLVYDKNKRDQTDVNSGFEADITENGARKWSVSLKDLIIGKSV